MSPPPLPALFDSHCHLTWEEERFPAAAILERARQAGVAECLCVAVDAGSARRARELAARYPGVRASVGIHPNDLPADAPGLARAWREVEALADGGGWVALGETGLDFYRDRVPPARQEEALALHLDLAAALRLPVVLHCRRAAGRLRHLLEKRGRPVAGVLHCFSEGGEHLEAFLALGLHVSFAGNLTYPGAGGIREAAARVPDDRLLVETDAPFLAPQPVRGRRNEPAFLPHTLRALAEIRGEEAACTAEVTRENARRLFGGVGPGPAGPHSAGCSDSGPGAASGGGC